MCIYDLMLSIEALSKTSLRLPLRSRVSVYEYANHPPTRRSAHLSAARLRT